MGLRKSIAVAMLFRYPPQEESGAFGRRILLPPPLRGCPPGLPGGRPPDPLPSASPPKARPKRAETVGLREGCLYVHEYQVVPCLVSAGLMFLHGVCWNDRKRGLILNYLWKGHPQTCRDGKIPATAFPRFDSHTREYIFCNLPSSTPRSPFRNHPS